MTLVQYFEINSVFLSLFSYCLFFRELSQPLEIQGVTCSIVSSELTNFLSSEEGSGWGYWEIHPPLSSCCQQTSLFLPLSLILWVCKAMHTLHGTFQTTPLGPLLQMQSCRFALYSIYYIVYNIDEYMSERGLRFMTGKLAGSNKTPCHIFHCLYLLQFQIS